MRHIQNMRREIAAVVFFLKKLVKLGGKLDSHKVELFVERLAVALQEKFRGHWYPENPIRGHAYRCIRINRFHRQDPELLRACQEIGAQYSDLGLPHELTLWVDPGEVCCRNGEQNNFFSVANFPNEEIEDKSVAKKVTSALERVTSDYHSGSSSDEDSTRNCPHTTDNSRSVKKGMNPAAPAWLPQKMISGKTATQHRNRAPHFSRHKLWVPPSSRAGPQYWNSNWNTCPNV